METKKVVCKECGETFVLTVNDQKWYQDKGFNEPKRCKSCRNLRKNKLIGEEEKFNGKKKNKYTRK